MLCLQGLCVNCCHRSTKSTCWKCQETHQLKFDRPLRSNCCPISCCCNVVWNLLKKIAIILEGKDRKSLGFTRKLFEVIWSSQNSNTSVNDSWTSDGDVFHFDQNIMIYIAKIMDVNTRSIPLMGVVKCTNFWKTLPSPLCPLFIHYR